jgi:hypothetical protein
MTTRLNIKLRVAIGVGTLIGMLFAGWFAVDARHAQDDDLIAEVAARKEADATEITARKEVILAESSARKYNDAALALDAAQAVLESRIEQKEMVLEDIEQREQDGKQLSNDVVRRARLTRDLDKLLTRQDKLLDKQNSLGVIP